MNLVHILPVMCTGGAASHLTEMYLAIQKHHPHIKQSIYCLRPYDVSTLSLPVHHRSAQDIRDCHCLLYKLNATDCRPLTAILPRECLIINLTASSDYSGLSLDRQIVAVSQSIKDKILDQHPSAKVTVIRNGVNGFRYQNIEAVSQPKIDKCLRTGRINSLSLRKHPNDWVNYIQTLKLSRPVWHDYLGSGAKLSIAQKEIRAGRNRVVLHGEVSNFRAKIEIVKRWDAYLYEIPGTEGISMSMLEAMACGIPAIINNKPGNNEIIKNGVNGYICRSRDEMTHMLKQLDEDTEQLSKLKTSTLEYFDRNLDARHMVAKYLALLGSL